MSEQLSSTASRMLFSRTTGKQSLPLPNPNFDSQRGFLDDEEQNLFARVSTNQMEYRFRLLIVDESPEIRGACAKTAEHLDFIVEESFDISSASTILKERIFDILLIDVTAINAQDQALLDEIRLIQPPVLIVAMSACATIASAVEGMKRGYWDYLSKPIPLHILSESLTRAAKRRHFDLERNELQKSLSPKARMSDVLGRSPEMEKLYHFLSKVAESKNPVMILGEPGTGRPLLAESIHSNSSLAAKPFVSVDCKILGSALLESELFGQVVGNGPAKGGLLQSPEGGTLFLDEITYMSLDLQKKLASTLKDKVIWPGEGIERVPTSVSVRIIAATDRDLTQLVRDGLFRMDLCQLLSVVNLRIPPLRGRPDDIAYLSQRYLEKIQRETGKRRTLSNETLQVLEAYQWPENVAELEQSLARACSRTSATELKTEHLPQNLLDFHREKQAAQNRLSGKGEGRTQSEERILPIAEIERRAILDAIEKTKGDKREAARLLGISKTSLYRKLNDYRRQKLEEANVRANLVCA
jgi:DNA-binding NtrC family response regulator